MKYKNTQELFMDLPETVLLVGNGKIENKGSLIDSCEFVIRFNSFVIEGFEKDIGTKIDAISFWVPNPSKNNWPPDRPISKNYNLYKDKVIMFTQSNGTLDEHMIGPAKGTRLIDTNWVTYFEKSPVCQCPNSNTCHFGSGASLALNLSIFFNKKVHVVGFDGWKTGHHYSGGETNENFILGSTNHNPSLERYTLSRIKDITFI